MAKYLSLHFSDGTSLLFPHYEYKYCRKCTGYVWILSTSNYVQMFVSILSSLTSLFHKPPGFCLQDVNPLGKHMHGFTSKGWHFIFQQQCSHAQESRVSLLSLIWLKGIVEQTACKGAQIYTDRSAFYFFCIKILFIMCQMFWPWKAMVLIVVAWCWSIKILDDWINILWTSDLFCVTLEVHREVCLRIKVLKRWVILNLHQSRICFPESWSLWYSVHQIDFVALCAFCALPKKKMIKMDKKNAKVFKAVVCVSIVDPLSRQLPC